MIVAIVTHRCPKKQLPLFAGMDEPAEQPDRRRRRRSRKHVPHDIHRALFDKYYDDIRDMDVSQKERRIEELMDLPECALTEAELAELDAWIVEKCQTIQAGWSPRTEAKRRGADPNRPRSDMFEDDHGRILERVNILSVAVTTQDDRTVED